MSLYDMIATHKATENKRLLTVSYHSWKNVDIGTTYWRTRTVLENENALRYSHVEKFDVVLGKSSEESKRVRASVTKSTDFYGI